MDKRNGNISDTFGKYNSVGEVKNVTSKNWQPISEGRSAAGTAASRPQQKTGTASASSAEKQASAKNASSKKKTAAKKGISGHDFISQGNPAQRQNTAVKNPVAPEAPADKKAEKKQSKKKNPPSRTPKGRDLRKDAREQQKDREEQFRVRENYNEQIKNQVNHDEASQQINKTKRKKYALKTGAKVGLVIILAVLCIAGYALCRGALIETVVIEGNTFYADEDVQQVAGVKPGKSMLLLNEKIVRRKLTKKLPYIIEVEMERDYPNTVTLTVKTTTERYVISGQSGSFTLDSNRKVISESAASGKDGVYIAEGFDFQKLENADIYEPEGDNIERFALLERFAQLLEKSKVVKTAVIDLHNTEDVKVIVDGNIAVYFADCKDLEEKIPYMSAIIVKVRRAGQSGYIDMTTLYGYFKSGSMTM